MILKLIAFLTFMLGVVVGGLWVMLELAGAVSDGADWIWYLALGLTLVPVVLFVIVAARSRTRGVVGLTVAATVLLVGVVLTYPNDSVACGPQAGQTANGNGSGAALDNGALVDEGDIQVDEGDIQVDEDPTAATTTTDCK